jgi:hypothetical protein
VLWDTYNHGLTRRTRGSCEFSGAVYVQVLCIPPWIVVQDSLRGRDHGRALDESGMGTSVVRIQRRGPSRDVQVGSRHPKASPCKETVRLNGSLRLRVKRNTRVDAQSLSDQLHYLTWVPYNLYFARLLVHGRGLVLAYESSCYCQICLVIHQTYHSNTLTLTFPPPVRLTFDCRGTR